MVTAPTRCPGRSPCRPGAGTRFGIRRSCVPAQLNFRPARATPIRWILAPRRNRPTGYGRSRNAYGSERTSARCGRSGNPKGLGHYVSAMFPATGSGYLLRADACGLSFVVLAMVVSAGFRCPVPI